MSSERRIAELPIWAGPIRIEPLSGGITNENFLVTAGGRRFAARVGTDEPALGIWRWNEANCTLLAAELGVAPEVVWCEDGVLVSTFVEGTVLAPENAAEPARLRRVARTLRAIHGAGPRVRGHMLWFSVFQVVRTYVDDARRRDLALPCEPEALLAEVRELERELEAPRPAFCHGDMMPGNVLDDGERAWIIDWEYAGIGDPRFDLAGFCSNCGLDEEAERILLETYHGVEPDAPRWRAHRVLRAMAALRESLWAVIKGAGEAVVDFDYDAYRDAGFARYRAEL